MTGEILITGGIIIGLIALSFFFSGTETGMTAVSRARLHTLEQAGDKRAGIVAMLVTRRDRLVGRAADWQQSRQHSCLGH